MRSEELRFLATKWAILTKLINQSTNHIIQVTWSLSRITYIFIHQVVQYFVYQQLQAWSRGMCWSCLVFGQWYAVFPPISHYLICLQSKFWCKVRFDAKNTCIIKYWVIFCIEKKPVSYIFQFREIAGHIVASIFWLACIGANLGITLSGTYGILVLDLGGEGFQDIYIKPWTRIGPYIIGIVAGYLLYKYRSKFYQNCIKIVSKFYGLKFMGLSHRQHRIKGNSKDRHLLWI